MPTTAVPEGTPPLETDHPRTLGWLGVASLAMGGSNQSIFILGAVIAAQGSAAIPLLVVGLLLSWAATPGWNVLVALRLFARLIGARLSEPVLLEPGSAAVTTPRTPARDSVTSSTAS